MSKYTEQGQRALEILAGLARNPAVPFHEWGVAEHILGVLATLDGVEYGRDDFGVGDYDRGQAYTNGMESSWSKLKRGHTGTCHWMSPKYLHRYVNWF